jgi:hypothetical protein
MKAVDPNSGGFPHDHQGGSVLNGKVVDLVGFLEAEPIGEYQSAQNSGEASRLRVKNGKHPAPRPYRLSIL